MKENPNWEELLSNPPYSLKIKRKDNLILFNYSQIESDPSNEIVKEARGTIIEDETFKPICVGLKRFYNIDESYAAKIDWDTAVATSKEDGTLFFLYWYNTWHVKTRSTFDAEEAPMDNIKFANFKELFDYLISFYPNFSYEKLNKNYVYCLEGCSNFNRIVIEYNTPCLFHLMTRNMSNLQEIDTEIGIPKPQFYYMNDEAGFRRLVEQMPEGHEGIVVRDANGERVKIKTLLYFEMHRAKNNGVITLERIVDLILKNDDEEFLSYFVEYRPTFSHIRNVREKILSKIEEIKVLTKNYSSKKEIALDNSIPNWEKRFYFNAFDKRENNLELRDWCKLIEMWEVMHNESIE